MPDEPKSEQVLAALFGALATTLPPGAQLLRNAVLPERIPAAGLMVLRDGDPGEPEVLLSPPRYYYEHRAELDLLVDRPTPAARDAAFDTACRAIARALAADPRFILLDEPFAGVDPLSVVDIQRIIAHLKERGIGVLITDHNVRETLGICDRAYIVTEGHTIAEGDPESILQDRRVREVYLGEDFKL